MFKYVMIFFILVGCKPHPTTGKSTPSKNNEGLYASSKSEIDPTANYFEIFFKKTFIRKASDLPTSATVESAKIPYSGYWYPEKKGGTTVILADNMSALQKYDQTFNVGKPSAQDWEHINHGLGQTGEIKNWYGHCNGFSAAAQRHAEPKNDVTRGSIVFHPHDIKALLAEIYMSAKFLYLAGNRCEKPFDKTKPTEFSNPLNRRNQEVMGSCEDTNPGTFHLLVTNWIGLAKHTLLMDEYLATEVWNYPHYSYRFTQTAVTKEEALKVIGDSQTQNYRFNPNAKKFYSVDMTISYADALTVEKIGTAPPTTKEVQSNYTYILEADDQDHIIGGEWSVKNQISHPDFVWVALEPTAGTGSRNLSNPHVNPGEVLRLWAESIGADPKNPPSDLKEPDWASNWGIFSSYDVTLDGNSRGTAFLGKKIPVILNFKDNAYSDELQIEFLIDQTSLAQVAKKQDKRIVYELDSSPGFHQLGLIFRQDGKVVDEKTLNVYFIP